MKISIFQCQVVHRDMDSNRHWNGVRVYCVKNNNLVIDNMDDGDGLKTLIYDYQIKSVPKCN